MIENTKKLLSLIILLMGIAIFVRSIAVAGTISLTAGVVAGLAFTAYGAVRLYYSWGKH
ncbi:MAG: hypothetical protein HZB44_04215 [Actinobacteria bacterium]|nr:hypothetical protein [Actinomycetota bacterium]